MPLSAPQIHAAVRACAPAPRVLVAAGRRARPRIARILGGWRTSTIEALDELPAALAGQSYDLILVDAHFDASQGLRALEKVLRAHPGCPVAGVIAIPFDPRVGRFGHRLFRATCMALGAHAALDLTDHPADEDGDERARQRLAALIA